MDRKEFETMRVQERAEKYLVTRKLVACLLYWLSYDCSHLIKLSFDSSTAIHQS
jgi:hypothetical protein